MIKTLAVFRGRHLGIGLDHGKWFSFYGTSLLPLPGRHGSMADAMAELEDEIERYDAAAERIEHASNYRYQRRWRPPA
jgi:hypothetical protein